MDASIPACFEQNSLPAFDMSYLGLGAMLLLLALLIAAFTAMLLHRGRHWLGRQASPLDSWLGGQRYTARPWGLFKSRFSRQQWHGLMLTVAGLIIVLMLSWFEEIFEGWQEQELLYRIDQATYCVLSGLFQDGSLAGVRFITHFADMLTVVVLSLALLGLLLWQRRRWHALALFLAIAVGQALVWGLKWLSARDRPEAQLIEAAGQSFPSAHAYAAVIFYGFVLFMVWQWTANRALRALGTVALVSLILAIALSRILLSVHWVSDVLGGLAMGLAWLMASLILARSWFAYRERSADGISEP